MDRYSVKPVLDDDPDELDRRGDGPYVLKDVCLLTCELNRSLHWIISSWIEEGFGEGVL